MNREEGEEVKAVQVVSQDEVNNSSDRLFYSSSEMAQMCGVHINTWLFWVRRGEAPRPIEINGARRWTATAIEKWMLTKVKESGRIRV